MDFIDELYNGFSYEKTEGYDREKARQRALKKVLPYIMKNELTERQRICLQYKYAAKMSQGEIAERLHLSQPTVSRHINTAKDIVNGELKYCYFAVSSALDSYGG